MTENLRLVVPRTVEAIKAGIDRRQHLGVQLSISRAGEVLADGAVGTSHDDVPLTGGTLLPWLSAGKPLTTVCVMRLVEAGQITLETSIGDVVPEFHQTIHPVTIRHLLTHTAGLRPTPTGWPGASWADIISTICAAGIQEDWVPGERAGYDPQSGWFLLGEIVRRIDGRPIETVVREVILLPLGMNDTWMSMPPGQRETYVDRIGRTYNVQGPVQELTEGHTAAYCESPSPGASMRGPIRELRLFYEMLLAGGITSGGVRILSEESIAQMTSRQRQGMYDETFQHTLDFGLGVIINSNRYGVETVPYGYGEQATERAFGHGGSRCCIAFADPDTGLVVCMVCNGYVSEPQHQKRMRTLLAAIDADIGDVAP